MLSKPATMLLGLIHEKPLNAYEITKWLGHMNVRWWFNIADSTVYATIKTLEKKGLICGNNEKIGNMPDRTVYSLTELGKNELRKTLKDSILKFDYDTNVFSIAAFFLHVFECEERKELLEKRLEILRKCKAGIENQISPEWINGTSRCHVANVQRMSDIVSAEICGTKRLLESCEDT